MLKRLFSSITLILTLTIFSLVLIVGSEDAQDHLHAPTQETLSAAGLMSGADLQALASHFGASVPYVTASGTGIVEDASYPGGYARLFTFRDANGVTVSAVRPAAAAQIINPGNLSFDVSQTYIISNMKAVLATDEDGSYLFFSDDTAAYCLHIADSPLSITNLISQLQFTN